MARTRVFISGPYSHPDPDVNTRRAIRAGHALMDRGYLPYVPHLFHYMELQRPRRRSDWLDLDNEFLALCHCVLRLPGKSPGADAEVALAVALGLPVYLSIVDLIEVEKPERESRK